MNSGLDSSRTLSGATAFFRIRFMVFRRIVVPACVIGVLFSVVWWYRSVAVRDTAEGRLPPASAEVAASPADEGRNRGGISSQAEAFCSACHAMPPAGSFPKSAWRKEVQQGFEFYRASRRGDLVEPSQESVVALFEARAPEILPLPDVPPDEDSPALLFEPEHLALTGLSQVPALAHVHLLQLAGDGRLSLVYCDMHSGEVGEVRFGASETSAVVLAWLSNPCHVEPCDLNQDGIVDLIVADLGSFGPGDHGRGRVVCLHRESPDASEWHATTLASRLGRVADVQPGDFDNDGDIDLLVAEFGWRKTGRILLLENIQKQARNLPEFRLRVLDERHGAIHVPPVDLNGDGLLDFLALISQEHEVIEAFLNQGGGIFRRETIYAAGDPAFGSTGIQIVDLDADGDQDVLYTNGDAMDSYLVKPYHGVQWLENTGTFPFQYHRLAELPGASRALAADLDQDGLLDVVAAAYLPDHILSHYPQGHFDSLIWLKQNPAGVFTRHRLERGNLQHLSLELGDPQGDGRISIFTGNFAGNPDRREPRMTVWKERPARRRAAEP
jgi:hypothetical protein